MMTKLKIKYAGSITLLIIIGGLLYLNILEAPFIFDDGTNIVENPHIRMKAITFEQIAQIKHSLCPRPFANFTFALNYYFHQYQVTGYHLINIVIHVVTAILIFFITSVTLRLRPQVATYPAALTASLVWLVHPLHTQSVTYIVQRMNSLAALFYLLALYCYITARMIPTHKTGQIIKKNALFVGVLISGGLGLASKENAATLPLALFFYEWFFFQRLNPDWIKKQLRWTGAVAITIIAITAIYMGSSPLEGILNTYKLQPFTMSQRLLTEPLVIVYYLSLILFPHPARLNLDYHFPLSQTLWTPPITALGLTALILLLAASIFAAKKHRLVPFAILWFFITLAIESSFIGLALIFEHRTYLPSVFPIVTITVLLLNHLRPRHLAWGLLLSVICLLSVWTIQRNDIWKNSITLWEDCTAKTPHKAGLHHNLGRAYKDADDWPRAAQHFKKAIHYDPTYAEAYTGLGCALAKKGKLDAALDMFSKALRHSPDSFKAYNNMGNIMVLKGDFPKAAEYYAKAAAINNDYIDAHINLGHIKLLQNKPREALPYLSRAIALNPELPRVHAYLGQVFLKQKQLNKASYHYERSLSLAPHNTIALKQLGLIYASTDNHMKAITCLEKAVRLQPSDNKSHYNLACLYARLGETENALAALEKALKKGYNNWEHMKMDGDLDTIRQTTDYQKLLNRHYPSQ